MEIEGVLHRVDYVAGTRPCALGTWRKLCGLDGPVTTTKSPLGGMDYCVACVDGKTKKD
jgi:hypothetical protein